jgi:hypothetical protein
MVWIRQCELDAGCEELPPIPTRIASNEEFIPPPQSAEQREVELRLWAIAETAANKLGLSRRDFLRTGCGLAAAFVAMNQVFGPCYEVAADEPTNPEKVRERWPKDQFIFDVQTHHVDVAGKWYDDSREGKWFQNFVRTLRPATTLDMSVERLNRDHYVRRCSSTATRSWRSSAASRRAPGTRTRCLPTRWPPRATMSTTWRSRSASWPTA